MKLCLSGVSNSGKSTFFETLKRNKMYKNFIEEQIRVVLNNDYTKTKQGLQLRKAIFEQQDKAESCLIDFVTDRGYIDVAAYGIYYNSIQYDSELTQACMRRSKEYDTILLFQKPYKFIDDGFRVKEEPIRLNNIFLNLINKYCLDNVVIYKNSTNL